MRLFEEIKHICSTKRRCSYSLFSQSLFLPLISCFQVWEWTAKIKGVMTAADYPYLGKDGPTCAYSPNKAAAKVHGAARLPNNEEALRQALAVYGPVGIAVHSSSKSFSNYGGGEFIFMHFLYK